jgi:hypothetical protein
MFKSDIQIRFVSAYYLFLGSEVGLKVARAVVLTASARARICPSLATIPDTHQSDHIPSALFPHAQVLVGILFSSAALAQSVQ